jgi:hypothetical protein
MVLIEKADTKISGTFSKSSIVLEPFTREIFFAFAHDLGHFL